MERATGSGDPSLSDTKMLDSISSKDETAESMKGKIQKVEKPEPLNSNRAIDSIEAVETATELELFDSYLTGWRLQVLNIGVCLSLGLASLNVTIVGTSLVVITDALQGFSRSSWIVTAYLLTYTGFLVILAKLSDIFGRKFIYSLVLVIFLAFSIGCGLSQSMTTLIIMRAFQGIGGGGINAMYICIGKAMITSQSSDTAFTVLPEMVPTSKYPLYSAILSSTFAIATLLGPLLGGVISNNIQHTTWRWIFLLNGPGAAIALFFTLVGMPTNFPHHKTNTKVPLRERFSMANLRRVDVFGAFLLLATSMLLVAALEEGGTQSDWKSPGTLTPLILSLFLLIAFCFWERYLEFAKTLQEGVFPWRLATDRFCMGIMLNTFLAGAVMTAVIIELPQRFQVVNGASPIGAGTRLLALTVVVSFGSGVSGALIERMNIPPFYVLLGSSFLSTVGLVLLSTLSVHQHIESVTYGYQVILGLGIGASLGSSLMMIPMVVDKKDMAVAMSSFFQARELGGALAIAICTNVLKDQTSSLKTLLTPVQLDAILMSSQEIDLLSPPSLQGSVRATYAGGFNTQMKVMTAFSAAGTIANFLVWEKSLRRAHVKV